MYSTDGRTDLEVAVFVEQDVGGLEVAVEISIGNGCIKPVRQPKLPATISHEPKKHHCDAPVDDVGGVDVLDPAEKLVEKELHVLLREPLARVDDAVQVRVHQLRHDVHVREVRLRRGRQVGDLYYLLGGLGWGGWVRGWK